MKLFQKLDQYFYPSPQSHASGQFGYQPNTLIRFFRFLARQIVWLFGLNGNNRLMVEVQQLLDPTIEVPLPDGNCLQFCAGHGRLVWRAKTLFTEEPGIIKWLNSFSPEDVFFDVGANVGIYSVYVAKTRKTRVFSFEPEINNLQLLYANVHKNSLHEFIVPVPIACDNETSIKPFFIREFTKGGAINNLGRESMFIGEKKQVFIQKTLCMTMDQILETFGLPFPTRIKIDVDMNELFVVEGMAQILEYAKEIYIELFPEFPEHQKVIDILLRKGFSIKEQFQANAPKNFEKTFNFIFSKVPV
jgi:FkbM family methyltransferase